MAKKRKEKPGPACPYCAGKTALLRGRDIYERPHPSYADKLFWICVPCDAFVGCHPGTTRALGTPANAELRRARALLHDERLDPIWRSAETCGEYTPEDYKAIGKIRSVARSRTYAYLGWKLGLDRDECHTALFDLTTCRRAWVALTGITYLDVRAWHKARETQKAA